MLFLFIIICNIIIIKSINESGLKNHFKIFYWISLALGILIKGPIILIFTILPLVFFSIIQKKNFLSFIWTSWGFIIFLFISIPWFVLISIKSNGLFWHESVINDLLNKVRSGQESHGFIPGYYTLLIFLFFWPGSIFIPSLFLNFKKRFKKFFFQDYVNSFLILFFLVPFILYEMVPTKLPHYVFPSYTALSILISKEIVGSNFSPTLLRYSHLPTIIFPLIIMLAITFAINEYSNFDISFFLITSILLFLFFSLIYFLKKKNIKKILLITTLHQALVYLVAVYYLVPKLNSFWIADNMNKVINNYIETVDEVIHFGFNEPSLIFLTSHKAKKEKYYNAQQQKNFIFCGGKV